MVKKNMLTTPIIVIFIIFFAFITASLSLMKKAMFQFILFNDFRLLIEKPLRFSTVKLFVNAFVDQYSETLHRYLLTARNLTGMTSYHLNYIFISIRPGPGYALEGSICNITSACLKKTKMPNGEAFYFFDQRLSRCRTID